VNTFCAANSRRNVTRPTGDWRSESTSSGGRRNLQLMRRIDELHLQFPYYGARRLAEQLEREGCEVGRLENLAIERPFRLSNTLTADFCVAALQEALERFGAPEIFNTEPGSQFTGEDWLAVLEATGCHNQHRVSTSRPNIAILGSMMTKTASFMHSPG
jgi:hypothetical protein